MLVNVASNYLIGDVIPSGTEMVILTLYLIVTIPVVRGIALAVGNDMQFANLSRVLGHPEWAEDQSSKPMPAG